MKQLAAMRLQINVMGEMLTEEEKERYDIIRTNISNGTKLVIPERGGAGVAVDEQEKQEVPAVLKVRTRGVHPPPFPYSQRVPTWCASDVGRTGWRRW